MASVSRVPGETRGRFRRPLPFGLVSMHKLPRRRLAKRDEREQQNRANGGSFRQVSGRVLLPRGVALHWMLLRDLTGRYSHTLFIHCYYLSGPLSVNGIIAF